MKETEKEFLERLVRVTPSERQLRWQRMEYYNFVHFDMSTILGKQWGNGKTPPQKFNPPPVDTDEWAKIFKETGSSGVILTVKHHDGFCLYPSKYTDYTIANSPYRGGKGDLVKELSDSCRKFGLRFGIYLSTWDRHEKTYGTLAYNDFYNNQLTELLTNYGEIFSVWMDGACGEKQNGKKQVYDFPRFFETVRKLRPNAVLSISGPDVRWIGNEGGECRGAEWSVVPARVCTYESINAISQSSEDRKFINKPMEAAIRDLGSREALKNEGELAWYPAEMDLSITKNGFHYHRGAEWFHLASPNFLLKAYLRSVGHNATMLLNVPPDKNGVIKPRIVRVLKEFKRLRDALFADSVAPVSETVSDGGRTVELTLSSPIRLKTVVLAEDLSKSQRVERYALYRIFDGKRSLIKRGETIGYQEIVLAGGEKADGVTLEIETCRLEPHLLPIRIYGQPANPKK